jgi:ADP-heptose:LPS heptosyltransferase
LPLYRYHWFVESVTEFNEDVEQPNVYDVLFRQIGLDPTTIDPKFKRPTVGFSNTDTRALHTFFQAVWSERQLDLRATPYYVVAPFSNGQTRTGPYKLWLQLISELSKTHPVIIIGSVRHALPDTDISAGEFVQALKGMGRNSAKIINVIGDIPLRSVLVMINSAKCVFCLDSAPLYMAQACRVPAISLWGPHSPRVRLGYDKDYMDLAIHKTDACPNSPCYAYAGLPKQKCPEGDAQTYCSVLASTTLNDVMEKLKAVES